VEVVLTKFAMVCSHTATALHWRNGLANVLAFLWRPWCLGGSKVCHGRNTFHRVPNSLKNQKIPPRTLKIIIFYVTVWKHFYPCTHELLKTIEKQAFTRLKVPKKRSKKKLTVGW